MRKFIFYSVLTVSFTLFISCSKESVDSVEDAPMSVNLTGNGAPNGAHYNLNIIGVPNVKSADMTGNNGHRIFVNLDSKGKPDKINLIEGDDFQVLDANGTDGEASFQLPNPAGSMTETTATTSYSVWARALGTPGGNATITTCAEAEVDGEYVEVCSSDYLEVERKNGRSRFTDVSKELLTITVEEDVLAEDGTVVVEAGTYFIFDEALENYFWKYDNNGLKLLQLRFYEVPSEFEI
ncbi:hypothetical protein [Salegentibacter chungangensis]|uniref:Lipoprotein n=1 Tax=Salegentibacter chungangensis TaxID=1335724 RepID=A0ABW3NQ99_9FLAO